MKHYSFLMEGHPHYNYLEATVVQGLKNLGHSVYGFRGSSQNYLTPHNGEEFDVFLQCLDTSKALVPKNTPVVFIWGDDSGQKPKPTRYPNFATIRADAIFVRDYRGGSMANVFPLNFGIEDRYYCCTDRGVKNLTDRTWDVVFIGRYNNCPGRRQLLEIIERQLESQYEILFSDHVFTEPDDYWSKTVNGHCIHSPEYFETLANSKIILSPMGAGPDCARHAEALASGGIPLIEFMPTVLTPPGLRDGVDCLMFQDASQAVTQIETVLRDVQDHQSLADSAFRTGKQSHTTEARALYLLTKCNDLGILPK